MKPNELMIRDWVANPINGKPMRVMSLTRDVELGLSGFYDEVDPIPLTAEILEKNGFVYKVEETCATDAFHYWLLENSRFALADDSWWRSVKDDKLRVMFSGFPLEYVHQLQHALRLCNIDKEIKL